MPNEANIKRLAEIQQEIVRLTDEGIRIADEEQVTFDLSSAAFTHNYGSGGLEYYPKGEGPWTDEDYGEDYELTDAGGESVRGQWMSSNSWGC